MIVQDIIDELLKIKDKSMTVYIYWDGERIEIDSINKYKSIIDISVKQE